MRPSLVTVALAVAACSLPVAAGEPGGEAPFVSQGEVQYRTSAAYDATRVRGPKINMALTRDGRWGGNVLNKDVLLEVTPGRISGAGVNLVVSRDAKTISVEGLFAGIRVRVKASRESFVARVGDRQIESTRSPDGIWALTGGASRVAVIRFKGTADRMPDVPMPQWILAVIGTI
jgi:hypothetical protein